MNSRKYMQHSNLLLGEALLASLLCLLLLILPVVRSGALGL